MKGGNGWRNHLYNLTTAEDVIEMLAYNFAVNDRVAHQLDGWADITPDWRDPYIDYEQHGEVRSVEEILVLDAQ